MKGKTVRVILAFEVYDDVDDALKSTEAIEGELASWLESLGAEVITVRVLPERLPEDLFGVGGRS